MRFGIIEGAPTIRELAIRPRGGQWRRLAVNLAPEFRVVSGLRRVTAQQLGPGSLAALGVPITPGILEAWQQQDTRADDWVAVAARGGGLTAEIIERIKWDAFWDAPLHIEGSEARPPSHPNDIPPAGGLPGQPGLPRRPEEVTRATTIYKARSCEVRTKGARLEISFPGVEAGIFAGRLQYDVFKGSNLIRQTLIVKTDHPSATFKYDGDLRGLLIEPKARVVWRDLANRWQDYQLGGTVNDAPATVWNSNRLIAAETPGRGDCGVSASA